MPLLSQREDLAGFDKRLVGLIESGDTGGAMALQPDAEDAEPRSGLQQRITAGEETLRALGLCPAGEDDTQPAPATRSGLILLRCARARRLAIVFNGNTIKFSLPRPFVHDEETHVLLVRDPSRCFGFLGIPELGADYETCLANLRRIAAVLDVEKTFCVGMSAGGSAALKYGCDLRVEGILGFSIPTTLDLRNDPGAELRHYPQLTKLYRRARHLGIDLAAYYRSASPRPSVMLVYSDGHIRDAWLAGRMEGMRGVEVMPLKDFDSHKTYRWLQSSDRLSMLLERMFDLSPVSIYEPALDLTG